MSQSVVVVFIIMSEARLSCQSGLLGFVVWDTTQGLVWTTREGTVNAALEGKRCFYTNKQKRNCRTMKIIQ